MTNMQELREIKRIPVVIIYHDKCRDGFASALVAWHFFQNCLTADLRFHPANYGEPIPEDIPEGAEVYIFDFSYKKEEMRELAKNRQLVILDHHKTAMEELQSINFADKVLFDMKKSGAVLTWEHFYPDKNVPFFLKYIEDRDLWQWRLPYSQEINTYINTLPYDLILWEPLLNSSKFSADFDEMVKMGRTLLQQTEQEVMQIASDATKAILTTPHNSYRTLAVNTSVLQSEVCNHLYTRCQQVSFTCAYYRTKKGKWNFSLRSDNRDNFSADVGSIAREFGGGGHKHAAGFTIDKLEDALQFIDRERGKANSL